MVMFTGADVNIKNDGGHTALHYAASKGWIKIAEILISYGAKINVKDKVMKLVLYSCPLPALPFSVSAVSTLVA